ncbi:OB-fold domain-containing protein [Pseudomonas sp. MAG733B]|uniref:Zn-ribbon domain-containing OB-fold protein n=1 Tax=Pseudomonas sp. MAG733B TaxID=3122079 RepID=UPI0030D4F287
MSSSTPVWAATTPPSLRASRHRRSGEIFFPAVIAESPLSAEFDDAVLDTEGQVYSFTIMHPSPKSGLPPFVLAYVDLPGPVRLFGRLIDSPARPVIGEKCRVIADDTYGFLFQSLEARP